MSFLWAKLIVAVTLGLACVIQHTHGYSPGNKKRSNVNCSSNNKILQVLRDPDNRDAERFCASFINAYTTVTITSIVTWVIPTRTVTPSSTNAAPVATGSTMPTYLSEFKTDRISEGCSCIITATPSTTTVTTISTTLVPSCSICTVSPPLVTNSGFEGNGSPWTYEVVSTPQAEIARTTDSVEGKFSAYMNCNNTQPNVRLSQTIQMCPGITYDFSFSHKWSPNSTGRLIARYDAGWGGPVITTIDARSAIDGWKREELPSWPYPQAARPFTLEFALYCLFEPGTAAGVMLDDVVVSPQNLTTPTTWKSEEELFAERGKRKSVGMGIIPDDGIDQACIR